VSITLLLLVLFRFNLQPQFPERQSLALFIWWDKEAGEKWNTSSPVQTYLFALLVIGMKG